MTTKIIITKNKILRKYWGAEAENPKYKIKELKPEDLVKYLWTPVNFNRVSLKRVFAIMKPIIDTWCIVLNENIKPLFKEIDEIWAKDQDLHYLELYWDVVFEKEENSINIWSSFHAFGESTKKDNIYYAIDFSPVNTLKDLEIILKPEFTVKYFLGDEGPHEFGTKDFTLLEVFKGIFYEFTWFGLPKNRDNTMQKILSNMKVIE